jgi:hypothetical protein
VTGIAQNSFKHGGDMRLPPGAGSNDAHSGSQGAGPVIGSVEDLVQKVIEGIESDSPYIIAHGQGWWPLAEARHVALEAAFAGQRD